MKFVGVGSERLLSTDYYQLRSLARQGDNAFGSVRPSVRLDVCLCVCNQRVYDQSKVFVWVSVISEQLWIIVWMQFSSEIKIFSHL